MYVKMTPISSMCPASMIVGAPAPFTDAMLFPATSFDTSANARASSRQSLAGADSNPDGPGVSSSCFRNEMEELERRRAGHWWNDDDLHLNRGQRRRAGRVVRHRWRRGHCAGTPVFHPHVAADGDGDLARSVAAAGRTARGAGVLPARAPGRSGVLDARGRVVPGGVLR